MKTEGMLALTLISIVLGALGQVLLKIGSSCIEWNGLNLLSSLLVLIRNLPIVAGIGLYGLSSILWIKVLSKVELSYAYPMISIGYVLILILSHFLFQENISFYRGLGVIFIILGVMIVAKS